MSMCTESEVQDGLLIITEHQTAGKGQRGNVWEANPGENLTCSLIVKPHFLPVNKQFYLNIFVSLAIFNTLKPLLGDGLKIKWPNDIYIDDQKICGILIENILRGGIIKESIIGIGLNINQERFNTTNATSIIRETGKAIEIEEVLDYLLQNLEHKYLKLKSSDLSVLEQEYIRSLYRYNEEHTFKSDRIFKGTIVGVDKVGRLIINANNKPQSFSFKEVEYVI